MRGPGRGNVAGEHQVEVVLGRLIFPVPLVSYPQLVPGHHHPVPWINVTFSDSGELDILVEAI